ncbi:MAG: sulfur carrier protein ThiS [Duncaniella sp.]|uniref:sulfur carrier protein ThiS n=1 Tax=Duncaniella sp. TaxID=2518496 RepID=UPI0023BFDABA|nr:sulfur carrier protein ThiS [Duncaniella sp.]MDE5989208.1 sulfur carrier protein ThiS [Duncaniella sp.]MDE6174327.1 sulfur carrier protein ThiS [Duncaniella sp.]
MTVKVNQVVISLPEGASLQDALDAKEIKPQGIATAVNGKVIPAVLRQSHKLSENDDIVIIKAFYGG